MANATRRSVRKRDVAVASARSSFTVHVWWTGIRVSTRDRASRAERSATAGGPPRTTRYIESHQVSLREAEGGEDPDRDAHQRRRGERDPEHPGVLRSPTWRSAAARSARLRAVRARGGTRAGSSRTPTQASATPSAAPARARERLSVSSCRPSRARPAPRAERTASSGVRTAARGCVRGESRDAAQPEGGAGVGGSETQDGPRRPGAPGRRSRAASRRLPCAASRPAAAPRPPGPGRPRGGHARTRGRGHCRRRAVPAGIRGDAAAEARRHAERRDQPRRHERPVHPLAAPVARPGDSALAIRAWGDCTAGMGSSPEAVATRWPGCSRTSPTRSSASTSWPRSGPRGASCAGWRARRWPPESCAATPTPPGWRGPSRSR